MHINKRHHTALSTLDSQQVARVCGGRYVYSGHMKKELKYPNIDAARSVLEKIGVNPMDRIDSHDQDFEYTSCNLKELTLYLNLYQESTTSDQEKRVLGCYFLECLNEYVADESKPHQSQHEIFELLFRDIEIHQSEIEYWNDTSDSDKNNWWPITLHILNWQKIRQKT
ncbi:hypothetical protein BTA51_28735 [Hahella sp. CCB-MM4]|uniref:hypothetical protein n=1 Tax=Hahella sp. (strain CCB-MM4) TaxID=1926491 RepID=UPI000B9BE624|nr:hypothetical protein [Hahella sp. CCB-MM4]OZG69910.1 hypothetical protein BTA51_28735 [Hahella sp. CCB-MM4]